MYTETLNTNTIYKQKYRTYYKCDRCGFLPRSYQNEEENHRSTVNFVFPRKVGLVHEYRSVLTLVYTLILPSGYPAKCETRHINLGCKGPHFKLNEGLLLIKLQKKHNYM